MGDGFDAAQDDSIHVRNLHGEFWAIACCLLVAEEEKDNDNDNGGADEKKEQEGIPPRQRIKR